MKNILKLTALLSALLIFAGCTFQANTSDNKKEEKPVIVEDDVPATQPPFSEQDFTDLSEKFNLPVGNWTIEDVFLYAELPCKITAKAKVTDNNNNITFLSAIAKFDQDLTSNDENSNDDEQVYSEALIKMAFEQMVKDSNSEDIFNYKNSYFTSDMQTLVYVADVNTKVYEKIFETKKSNGNKKTNEDKTKFIISLDDGSETIFIYNDENQNEAEPSPLEQEYNNKNDIPAETAPFDYKLCPLNDEKLYFSNGNWTIEDIFEKSDCICKIISKVSYDNSKENPYNCTSMIYKIDFLKSDATKTQSYKELFNAFLNNTSFKYFADSFTFSHGYKTDSTIVLIAQSQTEVFNSVYLSQLKKVSENLIWSDITKSKYFITYAENEVIFISKDVEKISEEIKKTVSNATEFEVSARTEISQINSETINDFSLSDENFDNEGNYKTGENGGFALSDGKYKVIQRTFYENSDGSSQKCTAVYEFSVKDEDITFSSGTEVSTSDLSYVDAKILESAPEDKKQQYENLSSDEEKINFFLSLLPPIPENVSFAFYNGIMFSITALDSFPSSLICQQTIYNQETNSYTTTNRFAFENIIKRNTKIKMNATYDKIIFETNDTSHGSNDTTITYLIKEQE